MSAAQYTSSSDDISLPSLSSPGVYTHVLPKRSLEQQNCVILTKLIPRTNEFPLTTVNSIFDLNKPKSEILLVNELHTVASAQEIFGHTKPLEGEAIAILRQTIRRIAKTKTLPSYR